MLGQLGATQSVASEGSVDMARRGIAKVATRSKGLVHLFGLEPERLRRTLTSLPKYVADARSYAAQSVAGNPFPIRLRALFPALGEHLQQAGSVDRHYFYQDLWAARKLFAKSPAHHFDIGSRIDGFVAHALTFMPITVIDVRPLPVQVDELHFIRGDATYLSNIADGSLVSVSSLHALEHFGLGRYGDPVDPRAAEKAMATLQRVLAPGGTLYLSVPIGRQRLMFNAHRIFSPRYIIQGMSSLTLASFAAIDDEGRFHSHAEPEDYLYAQYACGLFEFERA